MSGPPSAPGFELGLALAGGVSCGAYTAGVVDFLVEALDAWQSARDGGDALAPEHAVTLRVVGGASSGALTAAVLTAALPFEFAAVHQATKAEAAALNPLYDSWVNMTGFADLLGSGDRGEVRSLLDPTPVERAARKAIEHPLAPRQQPRRWLADPLRLLLSASDLQGVRYPAAPITTDGGPAATEHAVILRFALEGFGGSPATPRRDAETAIDGRPERLGAAARWDAWGRALANAALGSAAVPGALPSRRVVMPGARFDERPLLLPGCRDAPARVVRQAPLPPQPPGPRSFDIVDGGLVDNTALQAVRAELNDGDLLACNPRDPAGVQRAVLSVDPLLDGGGSAQVAGAPPGLLGTLAPLGRLLLDQVRTQHADLALALDPRVYSRFLISPGREGVNAGGCADLAGASLGGLGGYLAPDFRRHDYLLGRRNAQQALATHMTLPCGHPLFRRWTPAQREHHAVDGGAELPIVPLVGALHPVHGQPEALEDWPFMRVDPASYGDAIGRRLQTLYGATLPIGLRLLGGLPWRLFVRPALRRAIVRALGAGLRRHRLQ